MIKRITTIVLVMSLISCTHDDGYRIEGSRVVYEHPWNEGNGTIITELDADPATFEVLGGDNLNWAKDAHMVFWGYIPLKFMDAGSFEALSINFGKDNDKVICGRDIVKEANPEKFEVRYYHDKKSNREYIYGVDDKAAYLCARNPHDYSVIYSDSIENFRQLEDIFYTDGKRVWWSSRELPDVDATNFKVLGSMYGSDGKNVYYTYDLLKGADAETFRVFGDRKGFDKNHRYEYGERIE